MVKDGTVPAEGGKAVAQGTARSLEYAKKGIKTGEDFANVMSALMSDLIEGSLPPDVGNAVCNAGGKLLKIVEMQFKYGNGKEPQRPDLRLTDRNG